MKDPNYDPTMQATLDTTQPAIGAQEASGMTVEQTQNLLGPMTPSAKTELTRFYTPWPVNKTTVLYSDGTKEVLRGDQT